MEEALQLINDLQFALFHMMSYAEYAGHEEDYAEIVVNRAERFLQAHGVKPNYTEEPPELAEMRRKDREKERAARLEEAQRQLAEAQRLVEQLQNKQV